MSDKRTTKLDELELDTKPVLIFTLPHFCTITSEVLVCN